MSGAVRIVKGGNKLGREKRESVREQTDQQALRAAASIVKSWIAERERRRHAEWRGLSILGK